MNRLAWVTGAGGLIGSHVVGLAAKYAPEWRVRGLTRSIVDLTDGAAVSRLWEQDRPDLVIHCAALTRTGECQQVPELARRINVEVTARLADLAKDSAFIFLSTDLVFDGAKGRYTETDSPNPLSVYGETKLEAERGVLANPKHTVARTSLNGGKSPSGDRSFTEEVRRAWAAGRTLRFYTDEFRCPIAAPITARALWLLAAKGQPGLYHLAGSQRLSRWEIGQMLAACWLELNPQLEPATLREAAGPPRAPDTSLDCAKLEKLLGLRLPGFGEWLAGYADEAF